MRLLAPQPPRSTGRRRWNAYGQLTFISVFKVPFSAPYTNANGSNNSFNTGYEQTSGTACTSFLGAKLWQGGELFTSSPTSSPSELSTLHGLGGATENFELQKTGSVTPTFYRARFFYRQTWNLGGADQHGTRSRSSSAARSRAGGSS